MAITPTDPFGLDGSAVVSSEPGLTWNINKNTNRISGEVDGLDAIKQAADIILNTNRYWWQIYRPSSGTEYQGLIGNDAGYVAIELKRRITEALTMDDRILGIRNYKFRLDGDKLNVEFVVISVYGEVSEELEVDLI